MTETVQSVAQSSYYGAEVTLIVIDATPIGGQVLRLTSGPFGDELVVFGGQPYAPVPVRITGLNWSAGGGVPRPVLEVSNVHSQFVTALLNAQDLVGANVTIIKTFDQFLDNGENPDPEAKLPDEEYTIDKLQKWDNETIRWQLSPLLDQRGVKLPRRQILREVCASRYRVFASDAFDYSKATCPYDGASYFDLQNNPCAMAQDACAKNLSACRLRFGANAELPFDGYPGAARVRDDV